MRNFPYTDAQVQRLYHAAQQTTIGFDAGDIREILRGAHDAGITVTFPEYTYECVRYTIHGVDGWAIRDVTDGYRVKAWFGDDLIDAENDAHELCTQLNAEAGA